MSALEQNNEGSFRAPSPKEGNIAVMSGKRAGIIVVGCFVTLILGLHAISPEKPIFVFDPPYLAPLLNTVFVFLMPLVVTFVTWRSFMVSGVLTTLFFSCGVFCIGVTMMAATWLQYPYSANVGVTIHNVGSLAASMLFGVGVIASISVGGYRTEASARRLVSIAGYSSILVLAILLSLETIRGNIPVFFIPAVGFSPLRQGVLGSAIVLFLFSSLFLIKIYFRDKAAFLYWNSLALMLYASGLFGVWMQTAVGSPVGWVGRTAQFLSGVYFLIAARAALRDAKASGVSVGAAIASFFRESELNYKTLVETLTDAIISTDAQGRILVWNRAAENMFGYVQGEAVGFTIEELAILPDFSKLKSNFAWAGTTSQIPNILETSGKRKKGGEFPVDVSTSSRETRDGIVVTLIVRDITERKEAEKALRESEERLQQTFQASAVGTFEVDLTTGAGRWNAVEYELLGLKPGDAPGTPERFFRYVHPQDVVELRAEWEEATRAGKLDAEFRVIRADGEERWLAGKGQFFFTETADSGTTGGKKSPQRFLGVNFDITERKRAEEALKHRTIELQHLAETLEQRVKERTVELTDLTARMVSAQEDERRRISYDLHDNVWQTLLAIRAEIERLFSGKEKMDWAGLRKDSEKLKVTTLNAVEKIRSMQGDLWPYVLDDIGIVPTIDWYCREFERKHFGLTVERHESVSEDQVPLPAKIVIYRILQEALNNVAKHSQARHVTVRLMERDNNVELIIEDNGIGFDPEEVIARKTPWGGLGLLSIKARTELSRGRFGVQSVKGKGATICASWPLSGKA